MDTSEVTEVTSDLNFTACTQKTLTKRNYILDSIKVNKAADLNPEGQYLLKTATFYKRKAAVLQRKVLHLKTQLRTERKRQKTTAYDITTSNMDSIQSNFVRTLAECAGKKPTARRFSIDHKVLGLALYKQSANAYKLFSQVFPMPSRVTIMKLLNNVPIHPGINECMFEGLQKACKNMGPLDKYCMLVFDEMSLSSHLNYNPHSDVVEGFENYGDKQNQIIADHVQVFMLRGIHKNWKQPILFQFVKGAVKSPQIVKTIKEIVNIVHKSGLRILGTICDQGANNVSAINSLVNETRARYFRENKELRHHIFEIDGDILIPFYDPPHLIKGIRNNMLTKDITYKCDGQQKVAKWEDIYTAWQLDCFSGRLRAMPKITEFHVDRSKIKKMKVSICAQVFSHTVSSTINLMATCELVGSDGTTTMEKRAVETAEFIHIIDKLFDSVNGTSPFNIKGKALKTSVNLNNIEGSQHIKFWKDVIIFINNMYCIQNGCKKQPPTFKNLKITIESFLLLQKTLKDLGFKSFKPRYINQDALENFFGRIRQRGRRFVNPTCSAFVPFYKSVLVNNLVKKHSLGSNCEEDNSNILVTLKTFLTQNIWRQLFLWSCEITLVTCVIRVKEEE
ncbi:hypothetical protein PPYR_02263 [Photinus pyralis]|uniref:Transposable element P transposase n=1 Tax=Photinus pyralis TaxID=7054 RepID=A0A5N4B6X2_PHOPY|nr:hypothetical protein PPYR_02263 [Photinus pyralis]